VPRIFENKEWFVEEYLLTLPVLNVVFDEVFIVITSVPLEAHKIAKNIFHDTLLYMAGIYMSSFFSERRGKFDKLNDQKQAGTSVQIQLIVNGSG